ncbi:MAG: ATP-binding cassette domain-containing protein [Chthoniobacterales bacterium]
MSDHPLIRLENVRLAFGEKVILDGFNLAVEKKERLVVMGQSGSGKSTLLRLICGILKPNSGSVKFGYLEVPKLKRSMLNQLRRKIGMVYQYSALISSINVRDNLALPLEELTQKTPAEIEKLIDEKLDMVNMAESKFAMPAELSGGMKKRIGLARALMMEPELILYDEPSAGLDPVISSVIDELMIQVSEQTGATSIIVTHEMESAFRVASRLAMVYKGQVIEVGTPDEMRASKNPVVTQFLSGDTHGPILENTGQTPPEAVENNSRTRKKR